MANTDTVTQPIAANALNLRRVTGLGAVVATTGTALTAALGAFQDLPTAIVIAVIAAMWVALMVTGFVLVWDMRVRRQQTMSDNYLNHRRKHDRDFPQPAQNGDAADKLPGVPIVPSAAGQTVLHFGPFRLGLREESMSATRVITPASG
jgi:hypothetical protein